jgi:hypothetical protein
LIVEEVRRHPILTFSHQAKHLFYCEIAEFRLQSADCRMQIALGLRI